MKATTIAAAIELLLMPPPPPEAAAAGAGDVASEIVAPLTPCSDASPEAASATSRLEPKE